MPKTLGPHAGGPGRGIGLWAQRSISLGPAPVDSTLMPLPFDWGVPEGPQYALPPWNSTTPLTLTLSLMVKPIKQTDWPLPSSYPLVPPSWTLNLLQSTLGPTVAPPILTPLPFDWGTPEGPVYPVITLTIGPSLPLLSSIVAVTKPIHQDDWPISIAPKQPAQSWTWNYNLNLIGQDRFPIGESTYILPPLGPEYPANLRNWVGNVIRAILTPFNQEDWPAPKGPDQPLRAWTWSYNLNLIGQDQLPIGERITDLTPTGYAFHVQLRTWITFARPVAVVVGNPFAQLDWPVPIAAAQATPTWASWYNLNLIGQDKLPTGAETTALPPQPVAQPTTIFTASFNKNLIGQDKLPTGVDISELPPREPLRASDLRTWINATSLALLSGPIIRPFFQTDWPVPRAADRPLDILARGFNLNLIGKDLLPFRQLDWPLPTQPFRQPDLASWIERTKLLLLVPFRQSDWPLTPGPAPLSTSFTSSFPRVLIGQDQLPTGAKLSDLAPRDYQRPIDLRTWAISFSLPLTSGPPIKPIFQTDWPINLGALQPNRSFDAAFPRELIGQDRLPNRQQDWPLTPAAQRASDLATWIDRTKLLLRPPTHQTDWPLPPPLTQPDRSFTQAFPRTLIGKDKLPFRQTDWPLPRDARQPDNRGPREFTSSLNLALKFPPFTGLLPRNQYSWPLPQQPAPLWQRYSYEFQGGNLYPIFINPIPPVPPPTPPTDERIVYNAGNEWQMLDRIREPGPVGWR